MRMNIPIGVSLCHFEDTGERVRLSSMGDGINRILTVILALVNCKGGVFLLDEFETGFTIRYRPNCGELSSCFPKN